MIKKSFDIKDILDKSGFPTEKELVENLLLNHPLECHICEKSGECALQNAFMEHCDNSSYVISEDTDKASHIVEISPLIKTAMDRCIDCDRCAQFALEVAGVNGQGLSKPHEYIAEVAKTEISGNLINICPVGAINSNARKSIYNIWELAQTNTIDVLDAVGSNIKIHSKDNKAIKVTSRGNVYVNGDFISDKTRFAIDGLRNHRLDKPFIKDDKGDLQEASWEDALAKIAEKAKDKKIGAVIGDMVDCETMFLLQDLADEVECRQDGAVYDVNHSISYRFNSSFSGIDKTDLILIIGADPKNEAAVTNARIFSNWNSRKFKIGYIGVKPELPYECEHLGDNYKALNDLLENNDSDFSQALAKATYPMIILGANALRRKDGKFIQGIVSQIVKKYEIIRDGWNGYNMLHTQASRIGALRMRCVSDKPLEDILKMDVLYLLGADEVNAADISNKSFVIYQGHHTDKLASFADVVLPEVAYTEKTSTYVNMEGRAQRSKKAVKTIGSAKEGWKIVSEVANAIGNDVGFETIDELREAMVETHTMFKNIGKFVPAKLHEFGEGGKVDEAPIATSFNNFYLSDVISRASSNMVSRVKGSLEEEVEDE